ncbi:MAG: hypothetical protein AB7O24_25220 [Kofleriaceae bacterium]
MALRFEICVHGAMRVTSLVMLGIAVLGPGCKKGNDDVKKKVTAVRDKALACKDSRCAAAASEEFISLTKDLGGLSEADAKFVGDIGTEIRTLEVKLESAPPSAGAAPAAASEARTKAPGFSVALPEGWQVRPSKGADSLLMAAKGTSMADASMLSVADVKRAIDITTEEACKARGMEQAKGVEGELVKTMLLDLAPGRTCLARVRSGKRDLVIAFIPRPTKDQFFYVLCSIVSGSKEGEEACGSIITSWQLDP